MKVNYDEVMRQLRWFQQINKTNLKDIEWVRSDGNPISIDKRLLDAWKFIGLSNVYFAEDILTEVLAGRELELLKEFAGTIEIARKEQNES